MDRVCAAARGSGEDLPPRVLCTFGTRFPHRVSFDPAIRTTYHKERPVHIVFHLPALVLLQWGL
jgi:hypothetical protein